MRQQPQLRCDNNRNYVATTNNNIIKNTLLIYKKGNFFNTYDNNAIIFNFLFKYQIIDGKVGFPNTALTKVINILDNKKIDYQIYSKDNDLIIKSFGKLNKYNKILKQALEFKPIYERTERLKKQLSDINDINTLERIIKAIENEL